MLIDLMTQVGSTSTSKGQALIKAKTAVG